MKRFVFSLTATAVVLTMAAPVNAAETYHYLNSGSGVSAGFATYPEEWPPAAGTYFVTYVDASQSVEAGGETYGPGICVLHDEIVVDGEGNIVDETFFEACADGADLQIDRRLDHASLSASFDVTECLAYDEETWECLEEIDLGQLNVDLEFDGVGPVERSHSTGSFGSAGLYQISFSGTSTNRSADVSGTIDLDGLSLIDGATQQAASMYSSRGGETDVFINGAPWE